MLGFFIILVHFKIKILLFVTGNYFMSLAEDDVKSYELWIFNQYPIRFLNISTFYSF